MILLHGESSKLDYRIPRESGDDPSGVQQEFEHCAYSPRERG